MVSHCFRQMTLRQNHCIYIETISNDYEINLENIFDAFTFLEIKLQNIQSIKKQLFLNKIIHNKYILSNKVLTWPASTQHWSWKNELDFIYLYMCIESTIQLQIKKKHRIFQNDLMKRKCQKICISYPGFLVLLFSLAIILTMCITVVIKLVKKMLSYSKNMHLISTWVYSIL